MGEPTVDQAVPAVDDVFAIYGDTVTDDDLPEGTSRRCRAHIGSTLEEARATLEEARSLDDDHRRTATLPRGIANAHVFEDGTERTAYTTPGRISALQDGI